MVAYRMIKIYGLKSCDTCRKAKKDFMLANRLFEFFDLKSDGVKKQKIFYWLEELGPETLINKRSTTWRELEEPTKTNLNKSQLIDLVMLKPTLIKRPLFELNDFVIFGYGDEQKKTLGVKG